MTRVAVHQLLPVFSPRDAIGAAVLGMRSALRGAGFDSEIFAELIGSGLRREARPAAEIEVAVGDGDCVIYHLSIGSPLAAMVRRLRCRRAIYYHNITPAEMYVGINPAVVYWLRRGREDLAALAPLADVCMAPSHYSLGDLGAAGAQTSCLVRLPVDLQRFGAHAPRALSSPPTLLFVGRIAPNKRQDELIRYLATLHALGKTDTQLELVGYASDTDRYMLGLQQFAADLGVSTSINFAGQCTDAALGRAYAEATLFVCASVHEGFCVPVMEAMSFGLPVVARRAGAVPETLDGAGLLLDTDDPIVWACSIRRVLEDASLREVLATASAKRAADLSHERVDRELVRSLAVASVIP